MTKSPPLSKHEQRRFLIISHRLNTADGYKKTRTAMMKLKEFKGMTKGAVLSLVQRTVKSNRYHHLKSTGRKRTARTKMNLYRIQKMLNAKKDPKSLSQMSLTINAKDAKMRKLNQAKHAKKRRGISKASVWRAATEDLDHNFKKYSKRPKLLPSDPAKRKETCLYFFRSFGVCTDRNDRLLKLVSFDPAGAEACKINQLTNRPAGPGNGRWVPSGQSIPSSQNLGRTYEKFVKKNHFFAAVSARGLIGPYFLDDIKKEYVRFYGCKWYPPGKGGFNQNLCEFLLDHHILPDIRALYGNDFLFMWDHQFRARCYRQILRSLGVSERQEIDLQKMCARSPDLWPIERVYRDLYVWLTNNSKATTKTEHKKAIKRWFNTQRAKPDYLTYCEDKMRGMITRMKICYYKNDGELVYSADVKKYKKKHSQNDS